MSAQERDIVAAANVDTFAGMGDRTGEVQAAMRVVGYGGLIGPDNMSRTTEQRSPVDSISCISW